MHMVAFAVLLVANAGNGTRWPQRLPTAAYDCVAVPVLMSLRDAPTIRTEAAARTVRRDAPRPAQRCFRLGAR